MYGFYNYQNPMNLNFQNPLPPFKPTHYMNARIAPPTLQIKQESFADKKYVPPSISNHQNILKLQTKFIATHKDVCRVAVFSRDGTLAATGSSDMSIKLLDVSKMHFHGQTKGASEYSDDFSSLKPVLRTFYDNTAPLNDLDFHPTATLLISCSRDNTVKFFDHEKMIVKKAYNQIVENANIKSVHFHPSGEYIVSGGDNQFIRIINVQDFKVYVSKDIDNQHKDTINQVRYNSNGKIYASCGKDGKIKLWDGSTNACYKTIQNAHNSMPVSSVMFSEDSKFLLSSGMDSTVRIWDISSGTEWLKIKKIANTDYRSNAVFFNSDSVVLCNDLSSNNVASFNKNTGARQDVFSGHGKPVKWIASSQSELAFISCSMDNRARFWAEDF